MLLIESLLCSISLLCTKIFVLGRLSQYSISHKLVVMVVVLSLFIQSCLINIHHTSQLLAFSLSRPSPIVSLMLWHAYSALA